jgi:hypothetical protein
MSGETTTKKQVAKKMSVTVGVRCHSPLLALLDKYRRSEPDIPTRASALRRLAIAALKDKSRRKTDRRRTKDKARRIAVQHRQAH